MELQAEERKVPLKAFDVWCPVAERSPCSEQAALQLNRLNEGQGGCFCGQHNFWEWSERLR